MSLYQYGQKWGLVAANLMRKLWASATAPTSPATGEIYLDISASPYLLKRYNGATWDIVGATGWIPNANTWTFSSNDAPTYIISVNADMTGIISPGMRLKLTHAAAIKYFIVTAVGAYSGGNTLITVYGGTDYTLAATVITFPFYSSQKAPFGFPLSPTKWQSVYSNTSASSQTAPTAGTWYNLGDSLGIPIGVWNISLIGAFYLYNDSGYADGSITFSTTNNSATDSNWTNRFSAISNISYSEMNLPFCISNILVLAAKTTHYLNIMSGFPSSASDIIAFRGNISSTRIIATCAYL